jgi:TolB-like protein/thioredoxin-like negative regulator of GroEL
MSLFAELKRRNVIRVGLAYVVAGWLLVQVLEIAADIFEAPSWAMKFAVTLIAVGLVPVLIFSWAYEITPEGIKREAEVDPDASITHQTGRKLNVALIVLVGLALVTFVAERAFFYGSVESRRGEDGAVATQIDGGAPVARDASVAVLPFTTRSRNEDDQFFSDGVHDDLLTQLAKIGELKVISRTSVMEYRDTTKRIPDIAAELGVATVVEGAVQRSGDMVRITAQLIDAQTDEHLWQLTDNREALEAYQRAGWLLDGWTGDNAARAEEALRRAVDLDPRFAAAWARLAHAHMSQYWFRGQTEARRQQAWDALQRAKALDPDLPEVYAAEGYYHYWGFLDYGRALAVLEPALAASPNDAGLQEVIGFVYRRAGDFDEAVSHLEHALELDPKNASLLETLAGMHSRLGNYERAEFYLGRLQALEPYGLKQARVAADLAADRDGDLARAVRLLEPFADDAKFVGITLSTYQKGSGDFDGALATIARMGDWETVFGTLAWTPDSARGMALWESGDREAARPYLERGLARMEVLAAESTRAGATLVTQCEVRAALGDLEATRSVCQRALTEPAPDAFAFVRSQYRVARAYATAGLPDEAFELLTEVMKSRLAPARNELLRETGFGSLYDDSRWEKLMAEARS